MDQEEASDFIEGIYDELALMNEEASIRYNLKYSELEKDCISLEEPPVTEIEIDFSKIKCGTLTKILTE